MRAMAWILVMLVTGFTREPALGQDSPPSGLQPGEVLVSLTFAMTVDKKPTPPTKEQVRTIHTGEFYVQAKFAARYFAPGLGKRRLGDFRLLRPDGLKGDLTEVLTYIRRYQSGEGGLNTDLVTRSESWEALNVPLTLPEFDIEIDLDAKTWFIRNFGDDPHTWYLQLTEAQSYSGMTYDVDPADGKRKAQPIIKFSNVATLNRDGLALAEPRFAALGSPQVLTEFEGSPSGGLDSQSTTFGNADVAGGMLMDWSIYDSSPGLELQVTAKGFADWRPTVKNYDPARGFVDPGKPLSLTAQVTDPTGKIPAVRIRELRWTLQDTSQLPGIAMNYPYRSTETSWDLSIAKRLPTEDRKQELVEENLTTLTSSVNVWPWDWGGWSTLRVEATLDDGMKLEGKFKSPEGEETEIRLPDRTTDSKIHRKWKQTNMLVGQADSEDEDEFPLGKESALGDGFSNFEEYRGFYVSTKVGPSKSKPGYVAPDPNIRSVFFYDRMQNDDSWAALQLFVTASEAAAYVVYPGDEFLDESRAMNVNRGSGPTQGEQHAIGIKKPQPTLTIWKPMALGYRPRTADIFVPSFESVQLHAPKLARTLNLYRRSITQALFRGCGVPWPGDGDRDYTLTVSRGPDRAPRVVTDEGEVVTLRDETGHDAGEDWLREVEGVASAARRLINTGGKASAEKLKPAVRKYSVAHQGGRHSGPLNNIMRDTFAEAYRIGNSIILLPANHREPVGSTLTVFSTSNVEPNRYGDSPEPAAAKEFVPNDHR